MPFVPDEWKAELLFKTDMAQLVSEYTGPLTQKGGRLWACCPFHGEKTPSFSVVPDKQFYYCFGCHQGGGPIDFLMKAENLTFIEAIKKLAERAGMELPEEAGDEGLRAERAYKERLYAATKDAARFFFSCLKADMGKPAREYLARRAVTPETAAKFGLGYSPDSWDALITHLKKKGYTEREIVGAGLAVRSREKSDRIYDMFRGRLMFPIIATNSRVLGFGARTLKKDETPKYINTGDTAIYNKRNNLYALNTQRGKHAGELILTEGYMDVISLHAAGVDTAIASLGTAMTANQARLIKRFADRVYICYDGDSAGQNAILRALSILETESVSPRCIVIPGGLDPDDYIKKYGKAAFLKLKDSALSANGYRLMSIAREADLATPDGREAFAIKASAFVASLQPVERERYAPYIAKKSGLTLEAVKAQCSLGASAGNSIGKSRNTMKKPAVEAVKPLDPSEVTLAACMLKSEQDAMRVADAMHEAGLRFESEGLESLSDTVMALYSEKKELEPVRILSELGEEKSEYTAHAAAAIEAAESIGTDTAKLIADCVKGLKYAALQREIASLTDELSESVDHESAEYKEAMAKLKEKSALLIKYK